MSQYDKALRMTSRISVEVHRLTEMVDGQKDSESMTVMAAALLFSASKFLHGYQMAELGEQLISEATELVENEASVETRSIERMRIAAEIWNMEPPK